MTFVLKEISYLIRHGTLCAYSGNLDETAQNKLKRELQTNQRMLKNTALLKRGLPEVYLLEPSNCFSSCC